MHDPAAAIVDTPEARSRACQQLLELATEDFLVVARLIARLDEVPAVQTRHASVLRFPKLESGLALLVTLLAVA